MGQESRTIVIYSGQHLLQQTQEVKAASKGVSTADKADKNGLEEISSIRFQEFICFYLFLYVYFKKSISSRFSKPYRHIPQVGRSAIWQKETHTVYLKDYSHRLPYKISTLATASVHGYMWHHSQNHLWASLSFCFHKYMKLVCGNVQIKEPHLSY